MPDFAARDPCLQNMHEQHHTRVHPWSLLQLYVVDVSIENVCEAV
jgi:hypothetical protein